MDVTVIPVPDLAGLRPTPLLTEERVGHYPEFREFFRRAFELDRVGLAAPGCVRAPSGQPYLLVFLGRSGEPIPSGVEIQALPPDLEPIDEVEADRDLYAILRWMIAGVGPPWTVESFEGTARLYRVPAAG
ncbi:MAG: hypothetical protein K2X74_02395 [Acetobacteraceae bacterium]|nr:hypothetical protein [Acetobacteraceae bacterium]